MMTEPRRQPIWRAATPDDDQDLLDLERRASLASLGHIFAPEVHPYPAVEVLQRWRRTLTEPGVRTEVAQVPGGSGLVGVTTYDDTTLRHLAVDPAHWGDGLGREAVSRAVTAIRGGGGQPVLWCLAGNHLARGFYEHLGWCPSGREQSAPWPPYPTELEHLWGPGAG